MRSHQGGRKLTVLQLLCAVAVFSILLFVTIQSSLFATDNSNRKLFFHPEVIKILSVFQSSVQQCVGDRGLGLSAHSIDHCNLILKFPQGTNNTWYNKQFKIFEPLEFKYNVCEALLLWEQTDENNIRPNITLAL
ncbi:hypothetical protein IGI04_021603 [Brassica rapa subsp. trilocularis]|uniref:S-protein homolog n=1 Tax=Brassica rapa subsp. trilocularis TaxID=1813537 RepID=A0ABQ7LZY0_BRACM|nr:hypothetical protein IGI04_021603 [Brassica rapa subsp. trilocularis]